MSSLFLKNFNKIQDENYEKFSQTIPIDDEKDEMKALKIKRTQLQIARLRNQPPGGRPHNNNQHMQQDNMENFDDDSDEEEARGEYVAYNGVVTAEGEDEHDF